MMLQQYCEEAGIEAEFIETDAKTESAKDAARVLKTTIDHIIKSLVFYADNQPFLVIVRGPDRVNEEDLCETLGAETARLATPDEVENLTGYEVGGVPPVGVELPKIVDDKLLEYEEVYGGAGSKHRMIKLDPRFIVGENDVVAEVTE